MNEIWGTTRSQSPPDQKPRRPSVPHVSTARLVKKWEATFTLQGVTYHGYRSVNHPKSYYTHCTKETLRPNSDRVTYAGATTDNNCVGNNALKIQAGCCVC